MTRIKNSAFTLTEILVVIVIIVIVLAMAMPVFKFITGSKSEEGATNQITAMLGRVRSEAIGLQKPIGLAFFTDGGSGRASMAEVEFPTCPEWDKDQSYATGDYARRTDVATGIVYYFYCRLPSNKASPQMPPLAQSNGSTFWNWVGGPPIDLRPDTDTEALPLGVGVQSMCDYATNNAGARLSDSYLGTGVILFSSDGSLTTQPYAISQYGRLGVSSSFSKSFPNSPATFAAGTTSFGVKSQIGLVVFDRETFVGQGFTADDPTYTNSTSTVQAQYVAVQSGATQTEAAEELWLDNYAQVLLINRFNGTLVRPD